MKLAPQSAHLRSPEKRYFPSRPVRMALSRVTPARLPRLRQRNLRRAEILGKMTHGSEHFRVSQPSTVRSSVLLLMAVCLPGCVEESVPRNAASLLFPQLQRAEIVGIVAGFGTTFAALPDLIAMLRRRSTVGMKPRMSAISGVFTSKRRRYAPLDPDRNGIREDSSPFWRSVAAIRKFAGCA